MNKGSEKSFKALIGELAGITDVDMRTSVIVQKLSVMSPEDVALAIHEIMEGNHRGKTKHKSVYMALVKTRDLSRYIGYEKISEIYLLAKSRGFSMVAEFLRAPASKKRKEGPSQSHLAQKLKHLTLGEKKAYARKRDFGHIEFLLHDTDPTVISNLLKNPKLTEGDVIKIAANKNATGKILEEIFRSNKWISLYRIKKALVFNENTPVDISMNLCSFLLKQDLKRIVKDKKLDPVIVNRADGILKGKAV